MRLVTDNAFEVVSFLVVKTTHCPQVVCGL